MTLEEHIQNFHENSGNFRSKERKALISNIVKSIKDTSHKLTLGLIEASEKEKQATSADIGNDIALHIEDLRDQFGEETKEYRVLGQILSVTESANFGRVLTGLDISGEAIDLITLTLNRVGIATIGTTAISMCHKMLYFNRKIELFQEMLQKEYPNVDFRSKGATFWEEPVEVFESAVEQVTTFLNLFKLPLMLNLLTPLLELHLTLGYRKRLTEIQIELYELAQEITDNHQEASSLS